MKAIFTGTEQDLIDAGFSKGAYLYMENCYAFKDSWNGDFIVILESSEILIGTMSNDDLCLCETALSKLCDLVNKNLVSLTTTKKIIQAVINKIKKEADKCFSFDSNGETPITKKALNVILNKIGKNYE